MRQRPPLPAPCSRQRPSDEPFGANFLTRISMQEWVPEVAAAPYKMHPSLLPNDVEEALFLSQSVLVESTPSVNLDRDPGARL